MKMLIENDNRIKNENFVEDIINIFKDFIKLEKFDIERIKFICKNAKNFINFVFFY